MWNHSEQPQSKDFLPPPCPSMYSFSQVHGSVLLMSSPLIVAKCGNSTVGFHLLSLPSLFSQPVLLRALALLHTSILFCSFFLF